MISSASARSIASARDGTEQCHEFSLSRPPKTELGGINYQALFQLSSPGKVRQHGHRHPEGVLDAAKAVFALQPILGVEYLALVLSILTSAI